MSDDNLGPAEAWQIKAFPRELRRRITRDAADASLTVGEYLTRLILGANDHAAPATPTAGELRDFAEAVAAIAEASGQRPSKRAAHRFYGLVDDQVRAAAGLPARKTRQTPPRIGLDSRTRPESPVHASVAE